MNEKTEMLHKVCKALMEELEEYAKKIEKSDGMSAGDLEAVDKLSHALKSVKTTIGMMEAEDSGYSGGYMPARGMYYDARNGMSYADGGNMGGNRGNSNRGGNDGGSSYARGRNAKRDSMGRYSSNGYSYNDEIDNIMDDLRAMMADMPADKQRRVSELMDELRR